MPGADLFRESVLTRAATFTSDPEARATIIRIVVDAPPRETWRERIRAALEGGS